MTEELCVIAGEREDETERNGDEEDDPLPVRTELTDAEEEAKEELLRVCLAVLIEDAEREGDGEGEKMDDEDGVNNDERETEGENESLDVSVLDSVLVIVETGVEDRLIVEQPEDIEVGVAVTELEADND